MTFNRILCLFVVFLLLFSGCSTAVPSKNVSTDDTAGLQVFKDYRGVISGTIRR